MAFGQCIDFGSFSDTCFEYSLVGPSCPAGVKQDSFTYILSDLSDPTVDSNEATVTINFGKGWWAVVQLM